MSENSVFAEKTAVGDGWLHRLGETVLDGRGPENTVVLLNQLIEHIFNTGLALEKIRPSRIDPETAMYIREVIAELDDALTTINRIAGAQIASIMASR